MMTFFPHFNNKPWIAESSYSGTVVARGDQVSHVAVDDDVFGGFAADVLIKYNGVLADYIILPDHVVARKPRNISLENIAGMGAGGITAMQFAEITKLKRGDRVLITGASGGTGTLVVQTARDAVGDEGLVVGTCSAANEQLVKDLGVHEASIHTFLLYSHTRKVHRTIDKSNAASDQVVDYKKHPVLHEYLAEKYGSMPFDAIIDIVGENNSLLKHSSAYLKSEGAFLVGGNMTLIHGGGTVLDLIRWLIGIRVAQKMPLFLGGMPRTCLFHSGKISKEALEKLVAFIEEGKMKPVKDSVIEFEEVLQV